jgi:NSS family neurotransmitter:Na+ symporter
MAQVGRDRWMNRAAFTMAAIGSAVGLGNVWRFPFVAYQNGGGAFLIPYLVALLTAGIPLMILEYGLGQKMQGSAPHSFAKVGKRWEWLGWWAILVGFIIVAYYAVVMAWCWNYLYYSVSLAWKGQTQDFFYHRVLRLTDGPGELGGIRWPVVLGLVLTWVSIIWIVRHGVRRVGKVVMVTVPVPIILIAVFVVRGLTLPGAMEGIKYYLTPDFSKLLEPRVWMAAYGQIFFSLSLGFGILIAYASYLPRRSDVNNNALITSFANCGTSYFAGFAVFSILGYFAQITGVGVQKVVAGGPGLAFVTYPQAISLLPGVPSLFGVLFFLTLLTLGIDSAFSLVEAAVAAIRDKWGLSQSRATWTVSLPAFALGLIFTTGAGLYWLDIVDHFVNNFGLVAIGFMEAVVIAYLFGTERFRNYVNRHSEVKIGRWWDLCVKFLIPLLLGVIIFWSFIEEIRKPYGDYPQWALTVGGWLVVVLAVNLGVLLMDKKAFLKFSLPVSLAVGLIALLVNLTPPMWVMFIISAAVLYGGLALSLHIAHRKHEVWLDIEDEAE